VKKAMAWPLYVRKDLRRAAALHALTADEVDHVRSRALTAPIVLLPNAIDVGPFESLPEPTEAEQAWPQLIGRRAVLYLGRIHPIKGLEHLLRGWAQLPDPLGHWQLVITGPDEVGMQRQLQELTVELGAADRVTWTGPVHGPDKMALFGKAEAFVLPSFSEGLSRSLLEASAAALPAVATPGATLDGLAEADAILQAPPEPEAWAAALTDLLTRTDDQRRAMGRRAREVIERQYAWDTVAKHMATMYEWLLGKADCPDCLGQT